MSVGGRVGSILAHAVPERRSTEVERIEAGNRKRTFRVTFKADRPIALQYVTEDPERLVTEGELLRVIADRTDVPVPPVVASGVVEGDSYLLTGWVGGASLHEAFVSLDSSARHATARTLGEHLGALHDAFVFDAFGPVTTTDATVDAIDPAIVAAGRLTVSAPASDWRTAFRDLVEDGLNAFHGSLAALEPRVRAALDAGIGSIPRAPTPRLFPWDYRPGNVLVRDGSGGIVAALDWESPRSAHREFSLAKAEYLLCDWYAVGSTGNGRDGGDDERERDAIREAFYTGYGERLPVPEGYWSDRRSLYRLGAITRAAFDSRGTVTRPGYPMVDADRATAFHRDHLRALL